MSFSHLIFTGPRRCGKTVGAAQLAKNLRGTLVCTTRDQAKEIAQEYGIKTLCWNEDPQRLRGQRIGPLIFDTDAVANLISHLEIQLNSAEGAIQARDKEIERLRGKLAAVAKLVLEAPYVHND